MKSIRQNMIQQFILLLYFCSPIFVILFKVGQFDFIATFLLFVFQSLIQILYYAFSSANRPIFLKTSKGLIVTEVLSLLLIVTFWHFYHNPLFSLALIQFLFVHSHILASFLHPLLFIVIYALQAVLFQNMVIYANIETFFPKLIFPSFILSLALLLFINGFIIHESGNKIAGVIALGIGALLFVILLPEEWYSFFIIVLFAVGAGLSWGIRLLNDKTLKTEIEN